MNALYPVILKVPGHANTLKGREKVSFLSRHARKAARLSGKYSGIHVKSLQKDERGAPVAFDGNFWSITHKPLYVAGVVAPGKTGIDIERIKTVSEGLFEKTARDTEWNRAENPRSMRVFFRFWTAKEAVLKASGIGIAGLSTCEVIDIPDCSHLVVYHQKRCWRVVHCWFDGHVAAVVRHDFPVKWIIDPGDDPC